MFAQSVYTPSGDKKVKLLFYLSTGKKRSEMFQLSVCCEILPIQRSEKEEKERAYQH
jgi:hypothetical protein